MKMGAEKLIAESYEVNKHPFGDCNSPLKPLCKQCKSLHQFGKCFKYTDILCCKCKQQTHAFGECHQHIGKFCHTCSNTNHKHETCMKYRVTESNPKGTLCDNCNSKK